MSNWDRIRQALIARGHIDENGIGRKVKASVCRTCHAPVLTGYDGDACARSCTVDPAPLSPLGEAVALLQGRYTVALYRAGHRYELQARNDSAIRHAPAGTKPYDVLAQHACYSRWLDTTASVYADTSSAPAPKEPPF